jgi:hypothetical protein
MKNFKFYLLFIVVLISFKTANSSQIFVELKNFPTKPNTVSLLNYQTSNDVIILKDGTEIECKIIEITENEIKYKKADNLTGPIFTINKDKIFKINYANGTSDFYGNSENLNQNNQQLSATDKILINKKANNALIWAILSLFIPYVGIFIASYAVIQGNEVIKSTQNNKEMFKSERNAAQSAIIIGWTCMILSLIGSFLSLIILLM